MRTKSFWGEIKSIFHHFWKAFSCPKLSQTWECAFDSCNWNVFLFFFASDYLKKNIQLLSILPFTQYPLPQPTNLFSEKTCMIAANFTMEGLELWLNSGLNDIFLFWNDWWSVTQSPLHSLVQKRGKMMWNLTKSGQLAATTIYTINNDLTSIHVTLANEKDWMKA